MTKIHTEAYQADTHEPPFRNHSPATPEGDAISSAEPGARIVYHVVQHCGGMHRADASWAHEAGLVILVQRRSKTEGLFEYLAVRTRKAEGEK